MPSFTVNVTVALYRAVKKKCKTNGYTLAFALRCGLILFLRSSHDELVKISNKKRRKK